MKLNERLKMLRLQRGMTQTELAAALRIGQTTVAAYENGTHEPQIFSLLSYADFLVVQSIFFWGAIRRKSLLAIFA